MGPGAEQSAWQRWRAKHPLYDTWRGMIRRCEDPKARGYEYYGGKGIKVCAEWHTYAAFEAWIFANLGPRPEGMTLDRLDTWGPYAPGNVRWATHEQQRQTRMPPWWEWPEYAERRKPSMIRRLAAAAALSTALTVPMLSAPGPGHRHHHARALLRQGPGPGAVD